MYGPLFCMHTYPRGLLGIGTRAPIHRQTVVLVLISASIDGCRHTAFFGGSQAVTTMSIERVDSYATKNTSLLCRALAPPFSKNGCVLYVAPGENPFDA